MRIGKLLIDDLATEIQERAKHGAAPEADARTRGDRLRDLFVRAAVAAGFDEDEVREGTAPGYEAQGTIDSRVVIRTFERETVQRLLPRGLELAPQPIVHHRRHPVSFLFSTNHFEAWFGDMHYREVMVAIPYVQRTDLHIPHRGPFIYMPRLYLDEVLPRRFGNLLYGFEKIDAKIEQSDREIIVSELDRDEVIRLSWADAGASRAPADAPNFETVRRLFDMPTVSQGSRIYDPDAWADRDSEGFFICSNVRYLFDEPGAQIQPITATLTVDAELTPRGLRTDAFSSPSLDGHELGAFRMQAKQTVSLPGSCSDVHFPRTKPRKRKKVVVLGGGPAACTAAFYLAQQREHYEVSLYTLGFRLGGKCAAGRGGGDHSERVEEHGLHAFVGFYENVFRTMRDVYAVADLPLARGEEPYDHARGEGPLAAAFKGTLDVGLLDRHAGQWHYFETGQRFDGRIPGLVPRSEADELPGVGQILLAVVQRIRLEVDKMRAKTDRTTALVSTRQTRENTWWRRLIAWLRDLLGLPASDGDLAGLLDRFTDYQEQLLTERIGNMIVERSPILHGLAEVFRGLRAFLCRTYADEIETDREVWFMWSNLDLVITVAIGIIESGTINADDLDDQDFRTWLLEHGLDERNRDIAALTMVYNTLFANERDAEGTGSNPAKPDNIACGVALRWFLLLGFGYKGFPAYEFAYSCPQTVFTPMYLALQRLGVKVHFFHEVTGLSVEGTRDDTRRLAGVTMRRQVRVTEGSDRYRPFAPPGRRNEPDGQPAWPLHPQYEQLHPDDAAALRSREINLEDAWSGWEGVEDVELVQGRDFDECVLGIALGALREIARPLYDPKRATASKEWTTMMQTMEVTPTASFQLWFDRPWDRLYSGARRALLTGFAQPWPSQGDFSHLIEWEGFPPNNTPRYLAYHTGAMLPGHPLDDHPRSEREYPALQQAKTAKKMKQWLRDKYVGMYDKLRSWEEFLEALNAPEGVEGAARLDAQYFHASVQPSDLYVLSQAGSTKVRLGQGESGCKHLFLCGDWTRTSLNSGCVEAATQSGMLAAKVISNSPSFIWSPGF